MCAESWPSPATPSTGVHCMSGIVTSRLLASCHSVPRPPARLPPPVGSRRASVASNTQEQPRHGNITVMWREHPTQGAEARPALVDEVPELLAQLKSHITCSLVWNTLAITTVFKEHRFLSCVCTTRRWLRWRTATICAKFGQFISLISPLHNLSKCCG